MTGNDALYRYFDRGEVLLYIGKSGVLATRSAAHIRRSQWMQFAARSTIERFGTPEEVGTAEREAIEAEHPIFNVQYNDTPEARTRLVAYLTEAGRPDLVPVRIKSAPDPGHAADWRASIAPMDGDTLDFLTDLLMADTINHAEIRLRALAAIEGYQELPRGHELEHLAKLAHVSRGKAYQFRKAWAKAGRLARRPRRVCGQRRGAWAVCAT